MQARSLLVPLLALSQTSLFGVHAHTIRYNTECLEYENRGTLDPIDKHIFLYKTPINYAHILATPTQLVQAKKEIIIALRTWALDRILARRAQLEQEIQNSDDETVKSLAQEALYRLNMLDAHLCNAVYTEIDQDLLELPEQDVMVLLQWAQRVIIGGDELIPVVTIVLNDTITLTAGSCCGDLPFVIRDHIYWQKLIEAGWVAAEQDALQRLQPVLHTNVIGEKFHFYKTRFGIYFRETLGETENTPGDLVRIVKYLQQDPRHVASVHGNAHIIWLKFPYEEGFNASLDGQYIPGSNRARNASWVYAHDFVTLLNELNTATV